MKAKITDIQELNLENNIKETIVTLSTPHGKFIGKSRYVPTYDKSNPSNIMGGEIATNRAYINYLKYLLTTKENELKGLKRLAFAMPNTKEGYEYIEHLRRAMIQEWINLYEEKSRLEEQIKSWKQARLSVNRSLNLDKEEKEKYIQTVKDALKDLSKVKNN